MIRKVSLIFMMAVALAAFLILRPYIFKKKELPLITDMLPDADFIGKIFLLDVARETSGMLFYNKIPMRDMFSYEFLLSQGKLYGLNLQNPAYLFGNEGGDWGAIVEVTDSTKIREGVDRLKRLVDIDDTIWNQQNVYRYKSENTHLTYGKNYLFIYQGKDFKKYFERVSNAKRLDVSPLWTKFLNENQFKDEKLVLYSNWKKLKDYGIETAIFAHDSDSSSFSLKSYVKNKTNWTFKSKQEGLSLNSGEFTKKMMNLHFDISEFRNDQNNPLYQLLLKLGAKISFPTRDFLEAWEGDLSLRQGGFTTIEEKYIESVLDDDFNVSEVEKTKQVKVPGFSLLFSTNEKGPALINSLLNKGILTNLDNQYRFLASPPLRMKRKDNYYIFYSSQYFPEIKSSNQNMAIWHQRGTKMEFSLDSLSSNELYGTLYIPIQRILRGASFLR